MSKVQSLREFVAARAERKALAAERVGLSIGTDEKPRDVILNPCEMIATKLEADGFTFQRSGPKLKRSNSDLTFEIYFQSDRHNAAGQRAAVWIHGGVRSATLKNWRRAHPMPWGGWDGPDAGLVTGGQIGNLAAEPTWLEWDFADKSRRAHEIADAVNAIRRILLPFFDLFAEPAEAIAALIRHPVLGPSSLLEYAVAALGHEAAEGIGRALLKGSQQIQRPFEAFAAEFRENGPPRFIGNRAADLAAVAVAAGLDLSPRG